MAGRGRGRGQNVSFNIEQLGFGRGEAVPVSVTQPPPLFPPLENRPLPLIKDVEYEYILVTQKDLNTRMRNSSFHLDTAIEVKEIQQYSDKICSPSSYERELPVLWSRMPAELKKAMAKRLTISKSKTKNKSKKKKIEDPDKIFAKLEKKETVESEGEDGKDDDDEKEKTDDEKVEVEDDIEEEIDEEMDEGTDYASNYFDNGEGYLDEDDNLDEGEAQF